MKRIKYFKKQENRTFPEEEITQYIEALKLGKLGIWKELKRQEDWNVLSDGKRRGSWRDKACLVDSWRPGQEGWV